MTLIKNRDNGHLHTYVLSPCLQKSFVSSSTVPLHKLTPSIPCHYAWNIAASPPTYSPISHLLSTLCHTLILNKKNYTNVFFPLTRYSFPCVVVPDPEKVWPVPSLDHSYIAATQCFATKQVSQMTMCVHASILYYMQNTILVLQ